MFSASMYLKASEKFLRFLLPSLYNRLPFMRLPQSEQIPCPSCWEIKIAYSKTLNFLICLKIAMKFLLQSLCATGCPFKRKPRSSEILSQVAGRPSFLKMAITSTYSASSLCNRRLPFQKTDTQQSRDDTTHQE